MRIEVIMNTSDISFIKHKTYKLYSKLVYNTAQFGFTYINRTDLGSFWLEVCFWWLVSYENEMHRLKCTDGISDKVNQNLLSSKMIQCLEYASSCEEKESNTAQ